MEKGSNCDEARVTVEKLEIENIRGKQGEFRWADHGEHRVEMSR